MFGESTWPRLLSRVVAIAASGRQCVSVCRTGFSDACPSGVAWPPRALSLHCWATSLCKGMQCNVCGDGMCDTVGWILLYSPENCFSCRHNRTEGEEQTSGALQRSGSAQATVHADRTAHKGECRNLLLLISDLGQERLPSPKSAVEHPQQSMQPLLHHNQQLSR